MHNTSCASPPDPVVIHRSTYTIAGQPIAVRISGDPEPANNDLFYYHTDHLSSTSVLTRHSSGSIVQSSIARYTPFGNWRTAPSTDLTDREFTGHKSNNIGSHDLGLIYMNARYYVHYLNRFLSADTIVPDPMNPQSFNRYSYVLNSPINFTDPSGHRPSDGCDYEGCTLSEELNPDSTWQTPDGTQLPWDPVPAAAQDYNPITKAVVPGTVGLLGIAAAPAAFEYFVAEIAWPGLIETGSTISSWLCLNDGDCTNEVQSIDPNKLNHIFGKANHNLDQFLQSYGGNQEAAFRALQTAFDNVTSDYTIQQLNQGIQVTINGFDVTVRGTIVDGVARFGTAFIP